MPSPTLTFSIVTPSFNQGQFIRDSLQSVLAQVPADGRFAIEHIVVDAASSDDTVSILQQWKSEKAIASYSFQFLSEPDEGMTDGINKGFRLATGDWLMWLNTDDYLLEEALSRVLSFIDQNPTADVIYGDCLFVDAQGAVLREKRELGFNFNMLLFYGCYIQSTACFYRRALIERGLYLDASYKITMDFEYYLRLAQSGARFFHLPEILAAFRWHGANMSARQKSERLRERLRAQYAALHRAGLSWMARPWLLKLLFRGQQLVRLAQRVVGLRHSSVSIK